MMVRLVAWVALSVFLVAGYQTYSHWSSPWSLASSPVLSQLPVASNGCGKECKK